jgi:hypothetical protein
LDPSGFAKVAEDDTVQVDDWDLVVDVNEEFVIDDMQTQDLLLSQGPQPLLARFIRNLIGVWILNISKSEARMRRPIGLRRDTRAMFRRH